MSRKMRDADFLRRREVLPYDMNGRGKGEGARSDVWKMAAQVVVFLFEEAEIDGGNDIYHLIRPFWSGTDDDFDTISVDGFEKLRNLKIVHHHAMVSDAEIDRFRAAGIECQ